MDDDAIIITNLNDFIFCPASIYFHNLYGSQNTISYQNSDQINGSKAHESVDTGSYSTSKHILTSLNVYSEKYNVVGKIDMYDSKKKMLVERKRTIKIIFDGYIFQLYAQYFAMQEMGYDIKTLFLYSMTDNKKYPIPLPRDNPEMMNKFEKLIIDMRSFDMQSFAQTNAEKCMRCIYEPACDRSLLC